MIVRLFMKYLLIAVTTMSCFFLKAQSHAEMNHHVWAGGVCCSAGTDFTLTLIFRSADYVCFDSVFVETEGMQFQLGENQFVKTLVGDSLIRFTSRFGYSSHAAYETYAEMKMSYYGVSEEKIHPVSNVENSITVYRKNGSVEPVSDFRVTESMTAYP